MPDLEDPPQEMLVVLEPSAKQTETRVQDAASARGLVQKLVFEDGPRAMRRTLVKGCVDGNPPHDAAKLRNAGLAWQANLNLMEGKALMDSSGVPYYALFAGAETYVECETDFLPDHPDHYLWCGKIAQRLHNMFKRWKQMEWHIQQASFWMRLHGIGPCIFERDDDWRFRALESGSVLVPQGSPSCVDERLPFVIVRMKYRTHELFGFIRDEEAAKEQGWDVEAVKMAIKKAHSTPGNSFSEGGLWEEMQRRLKNDDLYTSYGTCDEVSCAHLYVNEYSGKCSHFIITEATLTSDRVGVMEDMSKNFLYKHVGRYEGLPDVLTVFFQDIGDGTWHSVRGLADLAFKHLEILNRLDCRMIDGAFIDGGIILKPTGSKDLAAIQMLQFGPVTVLPAGVEIQNARISGQIEGTMAVSRVIRNGLGNNIGMFNQRSVAREDGRGEAVTAEQIRAQVSKESSLSQGQMALAYLTCDSLFNTSFKRARNPSTMDKEALRFQQECEEDGVPKEALMMARVRANRAAGFGSPQMAFMVLNQLTPIIGMLPEEGKNAYLDMFIQATVGAEKVRALNPKHHIADQDDTIAALENMMFDSGRQPPLASGQNDVIHAQSHLADAQQKLGPPAQAIDGGDQANPADMQQAQIYVAALVPHVELHLDRMRTDPTRRQMVKQFELQLKQVVAFDGKLRGELIKAQRQAAIEAESQKNATALDAKTAAEVRATDAGVAIDAAKTKNAMEINRLKADHKMAIETVQAAHEIKLNQAKHEASLNGSNGHQ